MKKADLIKLFKENSGWLKSKSFDYKTHVYNSLKLMIKSGEVEQVKRGLYYYKNFDAANNEMHEVAMRYSQGIFCLFSAWYYYELTTTVPFQHHLAFPHKAKPVKTEYPPVNFYYWSKNQYELGIVKQGNIKIYDIEKSVCDAVKFRNKVGEDIMQEVLKNYMQLSDKNLRLLMHYAKALRVENIIKPYINALL